MAKSFSCWAKGKMPSMIDAVIFDVDGVLINSVNIVYGSKVVVLKDYGIDLRTIPDPYNESHKAASAKGLLDVIETHTGNQIDREEFIQKVGKRIYEDLQSSQITADPDLVNFLNELKDNNVPLAISTSNTENSVRNKLELLGIETYFNVVITADDTPKHKPSPEPYLIAMERLGARPSHSIVFEDSVAGVQSGVAAGAVVVGFTQYAEGKNGLPGASLNIDNWKEISYEQLIQILPV